MSDEKILALANAVSDRMRNLAKIRAMFQKDQDTYAAQYKEWDTCRAKVVAAEEALAEAKAALDIGLATR